MPHDDAAPASRPLTGGPGRTGAFCSRSGRDRRHAGAQDNRAGLRAGTPEATACPCRRPPWPVAHGPVRAVHLSPHAPPTFRSVSAGAVARCRVLLPVEPCCLGRTRVDAHLRESPWMAAPRGVQRPPSRRDLRALACSMSCNISYRQVAKFGSVLATEQEGAVDRRGGGTRRGNRRRPRCFSGRACPRSGARGWPLSSSRRSKAR